LTRAKAWLICNFVHHWCTADARATEAAVDDPKVAHRIGQPSAAVQCQTVPARPPATCPPRETVPPGVVQSLPLRMWSDPAWSRIIEQSKKSG